MEVSWSEGGDVLSFYIGETRYDVDETDAKYWPRFPEPLYHYYTFQKQENGTWTYRKTHAWFGHVMETGTIRYLG